MIDISYIEEIVREAGAIMKETISDEQIHLKGRADFVTDKDVEVQQYLYERLQKTYPQIGFIGEEMTGESMTDCEMQWILDPIDGTTNYIYGYQMSAISLALKQEDKIIFGMVYNPFLDELFRAQAGKGTYLNDKKVSVSKKESLHDSLVAVGTSPYCKEMAKDVFEKIRKIFEKSLDIRRTGSAALDMAYVACGRQDAFFERDLKAWDFAAGCILVEEAGGCVSDLVGNGIVQGERSDILASCCDAVQKELIEILK